MRIGFTLRLAWCHRHALNAFLRKLSLRCSRLIEMNPNLWIQQGIKAVVLDFDGVLSPHAAAQPIPEVLLWLKTVVQVFRDNTFVLSNLPTEERLAFFHQTFPEITFVQSPRAKPYPDGVRSVLEQTHLSAHQILIVDDRLLTGILLAIETGCQGLYITKPYQDFRRHFFKELFFSVLRRGEKWWLKMMLLL